MQTFLMLEQSVHSINSGI